MSFVIAGFVALSLICVVEWWSARPVDEPTCSLDCRDGVTDENCSSRTHWTREEVEFMDSLDSQIGFKP